MSWQIWVAEGHYIKGKKHGRKNTTLSAAKTKAAELPNFDHIIEDKDKKEYWIEDQNGQPIGIIQEA